jgi:starch-binding outer membrane protein, SusD/RagB family
MKKINYIYTIIVLLGWLTVSSCKKYLDTKPDLSLATVTTLPAAQSLLDADIMYEVDVSAGEASADNFYLSYNDYQSLLSASYYYSSAVQYTWNKTGLFDKGGNDWSNCYDSHIYRCNTALAALNGISRSQDPVNWDNIKGMALFYRARNYLHMAYVWIQAYDVTSSKKDLGLPLRLDPDFNEKSVRSTVGQTYDQIISDLKTAVPLLPVTALQQVRPSRPGAYALLAETYLAMRDYKNAGLYADSCLQLYNKLVDFNNTAVINPSAPYPVPRFNDEVLVESVMGVPGSLQVEYCKIDSDLYKSYNINDLRKTVFFNKNSDGSYAFKGSYDQSTQLFTGLATDEMYLTRAEAYARAGDIADAMTDLNTLLVKRFKTGTFVAHTAANSNDALQQVLTERRKELLMRGLRWPDIKRLNKDGANLTLTRVLNGQSYTLPPNDLRYALELPEDIIAISGMPQNP